MCYSHLKWRFPLWFNFIAVLMIAGVAAAGPQPLPGGKKHFTLAHGNFDEVGKTTARLMNLTFDGAAGTVAATSWLWDSSNNQNKQAWSTHLCTFDGQSRTGTVYTPYGWLVPSGLYYSWTGTYVFNTSTGHVDISWTTGAPGNTERWHVGAVAPTLARIAFVSSNYGITHGRGFGSNASPSTFKTVTQLNRGPFPYGRLINVITDANGNNPSYLNQTTSMDLRPYSFPSSPSPVNCIHYWTASGSCAVAGLGQCLSRPGTVYHLASNNAGRWMVWNHFCAALPSCSAFPEYHGGLHPYAMMQVIDDNGAHAGFVGIHVQTSTTSPNFYSMGMMDATLYP